MFKTNLRSGISPITTVLQPDPRFPHPGLCHSAIVGIEVRWTIRSMVGVMFGVGSVLGIGLGLGMRSGGVRGVGFVPCLPLPYRPLKPPVGRCLSKTRRSRRSTSSGRWSGAGEQSRMGAKSVFREQHTDLCPTIKCQQLPTTWDFVSVISPCAFVSLCSE